MAEKEYLERGEVKRIIKANNWLNPVIPNVVNVIVDRIPAADVVEVVRCKDCRHWGGVTFGYICRRFSGTTLRNETRENDYCSFGAKMDGKGEGE